MTEESTESSPPPAEKKDLVAGFKALDKADKILGVGAAAFLLAFLLKGRSWKQLFKFGSDLYGQSWMHTLGFIAALGALALIITKLMGIKLVDAKLHTKLLMLCGVLPAAGFVMDGIQQPWHLLFFLATFAMAYAGFRMFNRDKAD